MATPATERGFDKKACWVGHIAAWQRSGLTQGAYCRQHGLALSSLRYWRARLDKSKDTETASGSSVTIVAVPLPAPSSAIMAAPEPMLVHVGKDFRVEIRGDFVAAVFEKLVRTLARL